MSDIIKVYALPCAGGTSLLYNGMVKCNNEYVEVVPIELSGHGRRMSEPFYDSFDEAVCDVYEFICKDVNKDTKYAILGYSMGGLITYEVCCMLENNGKKMPEHIFISSMRTPECIGEFGKIIQLSDEKIIEYVVKLGGVPKEIAESSIYDELFFPVIKNDFILLNQYKASRIKTLDVDMTILYSEEDYQVKDDVQSWKKYTSKQFDSISYEGGHFFINNCSDKLFLDVSEKLLNR